MSFFVTRPPVPVPVTNDGSTPCSAAIRATTGETKLFPFPAASGAGALGAWAGGGGACSTDGGWAAWTGSAGAGAGAGAAGSAAGGVSAGGGVSEEGGAGADPGGAMVASTVPTSTVWPSGTRIWLTTPAPGLGTSVSTLSVEISSSGSSCAMVSPTCFSHFVTVPSDTETPICGITTSISFPVAIGSFLVLDELSQALHDVVHLRDERLLERRREWNRRVRRRNPHDRGVEVLERLLGDRRRDLRAEAAGARVLVEDEHLRRSPHALEYALLVPRDDRPQVEHLDLEAVLLEFAGGLVRRV